MPDFKNIPVHKAVHKQVRLIAANNHRTLGGQVAHWVNSECTHPIEARQLAEITYSMPVDLSADVLRSVHGYYCQNCHRFIPSEAAVIAS